MTITSVIVLYAITWFAVLFMVLPLFVKSQDEAGEVEPGTSPGAPDESMMRKKLIWTTIAATVVWALELLVIRSEIISLEDITAIFSRPV
ncbi:MAG: DUF1467 family protein [Paracoccaceae bacterium]